MVHNDLFRTQNTKLRLILGLDLDLLVVTQKLMQDLITKAWVFLVTYKAAAWFHLWLISID